MFISKTKVHTVRRRKLKLKRIMGSSLGGFLGIGLIAYLSSVTNTLFIMPPFGATCVIAFVIPDSAFAQPSNIIIGHVISSAIGILCAAFFGNVWWAYAVAVGCSTALMQLTGTLHPPAAADPVLILVQNGAAWWFLFTPVLLGSCTLVIIAFIYNNFVAHRPYPHRRHTTGSAAENGPPGWKGKTGGTVG
jgi:CBS-domain-containing membrane protein